VLALASGCHQPRPIGGVVVGEGQELPILRRYGGPHSNEIQAMQVVVRDAATWARIPLAEIPVDFSDKMLLVVTMGRVMSDGYAVEVARVWREGSRLRVELAVSEPPPGSPVVMASPWSVTVVPRCEMNVVEFDTSPPDRDRSWEQSAPPQGL
jgi:hypothetical protein